VAREIPRLTRIRESMVRLLETIAANPDDYWSTPRRVVSGVPMDALKGARPALFVVGGDITPDERMSGHVRERAEIVVAIVTETLGSPSDAEDQLDQLVHDVRKAIRGTQHLLDDEGTYLTHRLRELAVETDVDERLSCVGRSDVRIEVLYDTTTADL
jgi:hypothetical protein